jgi:predicted DNA-binding transcriptional regulator AlpA
MSVKSVQSKAAVSVSEMARLCELSRSRFYALIERGVFPAPVQSTSSKRPFYDAEAQEQCLGIRATGIGFNGQPVLFNKKPVPSRLARSKPAQVEASSEHGPVVEAVRSLGLTATPQEICSAICATFPNGTAGVEIGEVIRSVFLNLKNRK